MEKSQFSLAGLTAAVAVSAVGMMFVQFVRRSAPGPIWSVLAAVFYFGAFVTLWLHGKRGPLRVVRFAVTGLMAGSVVGGCYGLAEDLSAVRPSIAVEWGSLIGAATLGAVIGAVYGIWRSRV